METEWIIADNYVPYDLAVSTMESRVASIRAGTAPECVWLLEHPPLYTAGTSAVDGDLLAPQFPVHQTGRGGQYTYHGPGQRVCYVMVDLRRRDNDVRQHVWRLEEWLIRTVAAFDITAERRPGRVGLWVAGADGIDKKIAAIGVRVRNGVTYHGAALNVDPDLSHFAGIVPCGIRDAGVTSIALETIAHKKTASTPVCMDAVDVVLQAEWPALFIPIHP